MIAKQPEKCDDCGEVVEQWTVVKGWALVCDRCLFKRLAQQNPKEPR